MLIDDLTTDQLIRFPSGRVFRVSEVHLNGWVTLQQTGGPVSGTSGPIPIIHGAEVVRLGAEIVSYTDCAETAIATE